VYFLISLRLILFRHRTSSFAIDFRSLFVHRLQILESGEFEMNTGLELLVLIIALSGAWLAAGCAALIYFRPKQAPALLTAQGAAQLLRAETEIVRGAVEDQAGRLRQELNQSLKGFQELTVTAFGGLRDGIEGQLRWLARKDPNLDEVQKALQGIVDDGRRAADIITSIRGMFRKDNHERLLLSVNDLVREVLTLIHGDLERRQIILRSDFHDVLPKITGERVPLQQVLLNLIMNAAEAMSEVTGRERLLTIRVALDERTSVRVTLEDSGCGIDEAHLDRIFEPFFTTKSRGMGLGLSICRSIIESHGGRLWALPRSPFGTAFHLTLPSAEAV
jgi:signal transduction histidine kinase